MSVTVVQDYPRRHRARRLRRWIGTLAGSVMVFVALVASIVVLPSVFYLFFYVYGIVEGERFVDIPVSNADVLLAAAVSITITVVGLKVGLRLVRGNRKLVLFLRRFGYGDATRVATFAAAKTIGRSWRLVTLDDAAVAPLGMPAGTSRLVRGAGLIRQGFMVAATFVTELCPFSLGAPWFIVGLAFLQMEIQGLDIGDSFEPYARVYVSVMEGRIPFDAMGPNLVGAFAVAATLCMFTLLALLVVFVASLVVILLSVPFSLLDFASGAVRTADKSTTRHVDNAQEIDKMAKALASESRKIFAPRLVVLRVASEVWQQMVMRLASAGSLTIIDVSEPTENLLWEIQALTEQFGPRCVFVGKSDRVAALTGSSETVPPRGPIVERLQRLLDGREVLAYMTNRRGMRRFARALRSRLLELSDLRPRAR